MNASEFEIFQQAMGGATEQDAKKFAEYLIVHGYEITIDLNHVYVCKAGDDENIDDAAWSRLMDGCFNG